MKTQHVRVVSVSVHLCNDYCVRHIQTNFKVNGYLPHNAIRFASRGAWFKIGYSFLFLLTEKYTKYTNLKSCTSNKLIFL